MRPIEALAAELILAAEKRAVRIDLEYAKNFIGAKEALLSRPSDPAARKTIRHFEALMSEFGRFMLPFEDWVKHCDGMVYPT